LLVELAALIDQLRAVKAPESSLVNTGPEPSITSETSSFSADEDVTAGKGQLKDSRPEKLTQTEATEVSSEAQTVLDDDLHPRELEVLEKLRYFAQLLSMGPQPALNSFTEKQSLVPGETEKADDALESFTRADLRTSSVQSRNERVHKEDEARMEHSFNDQSLIQLSRHEERKAKSSRSKAKPDAVMRLRKRKGKGKEKKKKVKLMAMTL
jgi:hypothetical protein